MIGSLVAGAPGLVDDVGVTPGALPRSPPGWWRQAGIVLRKDLEIELASGEVTTSSAFFALLVVIMSSLSFYGGPASSRLVAAGVIWLSVAFALVLALGRTWQREREEGALTGLLVTPIAPSALFLGKMLGLCLFVGLVELLVVPAAALLFNLDLARHGAGLALIALLATPGLAASGTLFGSMTVRTRARDLMLAIVLFPLLSPALLTAVVASRALLDGAPLGDLADYLRFLLVFDVVFVAGGVSLFGTLVEG